MKMKRVWARLGVSILVDEDIFKAGPVKALEDAIEYGSYEIEGDSYVPEEGEQKEIQFQPFSYRGKI